MPKRVVDGEGIWTSYKLKQLPEHFRLHYGFLIPLASANGTFEYDPQLIHARCYAFLLPHISLDDVVHICESFARVGLLYRWTCRDVHHMGHNFGFWVGMEKPGRLPKPSRLRDRHEKVSCLHMPKDGFLQYVENTTCYDVVRQWVPSGPPMVSLGSGSGSGSGSSTYNTSSQARMFLPLHAASEEARVQPTNGNGKPSLPGFEKFWELYPECRRMNRTELLAIWIRKQLEERTENIIAGVELWKVSAAWTEERYIPDAQKFLVRTQWEKIPPREAPKAYEQTKRAIARIRENSRNHPAMD